MADPAALVLFTIPPPRRPAMLLAWSCLAVPDQRLRHADGLPKRYAELERAIAETISLGGWCDALAWCAHSWPLCGDPLSMGRCIRKPVDGCTFCGEHAADFVDVPDVDPELPWDDLPDDPGPMVVDTPGL